MRIRIQILAAAAALFISSCGSGGGDGDGQGTTPGAVILLAPADNSECISGTTTSATNSTVTLEWQAAANADSYLIYVKNLNTQSQMQYNSNGGTSLDVNLIKGVPYSWYVVSKSTSSAQNTQSAKWKFYNAGSGIQNYAPFPADLVEPAMSSTVSTATVNLVWQGGDVDNDITQYKVYMDTNANPTTLIGTASSGSFGPVSVAANKTYYWKVVTTDAAGNSSTSPLFQFKTP